LGEAALRQGDVQMAISSFEKATQLDPQQEAYRLNLEAVRKAAGAKK
jgi:cytochrome c-type biogenesis protein CcmH/NrfG